VLLFGSYHLPPAHPPCVRASKPSSTFLHLNNSTTLWHLDSGAGRLIAEGKVENGDSEGKAHQRFLKQRPAVELDLITAGARVHLQRRDSVSGWAARTSGIGNAHAQGQHASCATRARHLRHLAHGLLMTLGGSHTGMNVAHVAHPPGCPRRACLRSLPAYAPEKDRSGKGARPRAAASLPARAPRLAARSTGPWQSCAVGGHAGCTTGRPTPATAQAAALSRSA